MLCRASSWPTVLLAMGDLVEAEGIVRAGLAATGSANDEAIDPGPAGVLAARRGATTRRAVTWRAPARSCPTSRSGQSAMAGAPMAEMLLAEDDPAGAFELVERVLPFNAVDPRVLDELMVLGARAAADLVQQASDDRDQAAVQAPSGGPDPAGQDAGDPARHHLPALLARRHRPARPGRALRRRVRPSRRMRGPGEPLAGGGGGVRHGRSRLGTAGVVVAARRCADRVGRLGHRGGRAAARCPRLRRPAGRRPAARPASRSWPRAPASR